MIPPFVIPERSPYFVSKSELGIAQVSLLEICSPCSCTPCASPNYPCMLCPSSLPLHGPASLSWHNHSPSKWPFAVPPASRETLENRLRAKIIAQIEFCLVEKMNFTSKTQRSRKIPSQHLQPLISDSPCGIPEGRIFLAFYWHRKNQIPHLWSSLPAEAQPCMAQGLAHIRASLPTRTNT